VRVSAVDVSSYPALPYPGRRPSHAFVQVGRVVLELVSAGDAWSVRDGDESPDLDRWLTAHGAVAMSARSPLLCYGSNACPSKLHDLRSRCGLDGPVVMTPCTVTGLAAAWCAGRRVVDRSVPATLAPAAGSEKHALWWVAPDQWAALDRCEGRSGQPGDRYALGALPPGAVVGPGVRQPVQAYVGVAAGRRPLTGPSGQPLLVRDLDQHSAERALERYEARDQRMVPTSLRARRMVR
jgi:hypothetical protein